MATLTIKNVPEPLVRRLKARATLHRRSLNREVVASRQATTSRLRLRRCRVALALRRRTSGSGTFLIVSVAIAAPPPRMDPDWYQNGSMRRIARGFGQRQYEARLLHGAALRCIGWGSAKVRRLAR